MFSPCFEFDDSEFWIHTNNFWYSQAVYPSKFIYQLSWIHLPLKQIVHSSFWSKVFLHKIWIIFFNLFFPLSEPYIHLKTCYLVGKLLIDVLS